MSEVWKPICGYEDRYEVSTMGNVRSLNYRMTGKTRALKPITEGRGYTMVGLCRNGTMKWAKVHRLVAEAFIPNPEHKAQINHKDGNKRNNRTDNLEWVTNSENAHHAFKMGLKRGDVAWGRILGTVYGEKGRKKTAEARKKPLVATNTQTGEEIQFESAMEVERVLNIDHSSVQKTCTGRQRTAKGYTFRYKKSEEE